jgi:hypothetical protein
LAFLLVRVTLSAMNQATQRGVFSRIVASKWGKAGLALVILWEVRGAILAAPVLYGLWLSGGTLMAIWLAICTLAGIAITTVAPVLVLRRLAR